ncbi:MAG: hypothetical protein EGP82_09205 [Odoribacter splanchnicus]|nr:hypothetical protein [Odoribacter splanchnicus]
MGLGNYCSRNCRNAIRLQIKSVRFTLKDRLFHTKIVQAGSRNKFIWLCRSTARLNRNLFAVK